MSDDIFLYPIDAVIDTLMNGFKGHAHLRHFEVSSFSQLLERNRLKRSNINDFHAEGKFSLAVVHEIIIDIDSKGVGIEFPCFVWVKFESPADLQNCLDGLSWR